MSKSPGHRKWPDHKVEEQPVRERVQLEVDGQVVADSSDVVKVIEDEHPERYYFPRSDVREELLETSDTTTECPFKGTARYFNLRVGDRKLKDVAWSYEDPYEEHAGLKNRVAFHDERLERADVKPGL